MALVPPLPTIAVDNARGGFFEDEQWRAVREHLPPHLQDAGDFAYLTGWRLMEILTLRWANVDLTRGVVSLPGRATKNGRVRAFPFGEFPELRVVIARRRARTEETQRSGRIVPVSSTTTESHCLVPMGAQNGASGAHGGGPVSRPDCLGESCTISVVPPSAIWSEQECRVRSRMELVGHRTESVYQRYDIVSEKDLTDGVKTYATWRARK